MTFHRPERRTGGRPARYILLAALILFISAPLPADAGEVTVQSSRVRVRSGAGNYYEVIYRAGKGARLEVVGEAEGWCEVRLPNGERGYVSKKSLQRREKKGPSGRPWIEDAGVGSAASSEIMAATRGVLRISEFVKNYAKKHGLTPGLIEEFNKMPFTPREYETFRRKLRGKARLETDGISGEGMPERDREIGAAIALRLASRGVDRDMELRKYVSMVGTAALESTPLYDEPFVFIVLKGPGAASFATPGGYVFITRGAIALMEDEAQLAGVLSHEITHVVQRHGIKELERQRTRIESRKLMDSLDDELLKLDMDRGDRRAIEDLEEMADGIFEFLISGRKKDDEDEADRLGTLILYKTGYNSHGLMEFLLSSEKRGPGAGKMAYTHPPAGERAAAIEKLIKKEGMGRKDGKRLKERFEDLTR